MAARKSTQNEDTQLWYDGANLQAESKFTDALSTYGEVTTKLAKIHFNIGLIKLSLGRATDAITSFTETTEKDAYMALGFFARGVAYYEAKNFSAALNDFDKTLKLYRGSPMIDYTQLGMKYKLFQCEVNLDAGLAAKQLGNARAREYFAAAADPGTHIEERHALYTKAGIEGQPFVGVSGTLPFFPPANHVAALKKKNWVKKSEVKAAWNGDTDLSWKGEELLEKKRLEEKKKEKKEKAKPPERPTMTAEALKHLAQEQGISATKKEPTHTVKFDYDVAFAGDLELRTGDLITLTLDNNDGWYTGFSQRLKTYGVFPATYVEPIPAKEVVVTARPPPPAPPAASGAVKPPKKSLSDESSFKNDLKQQLAAAAAMKAVEPPSKPRPAAVPPKTGPPAPQAKSVPPPPPGKPKESLAAKVPPPPKSAGSSPPATKKPPPGRRAPSLSRSTSLSDDIRSTESSRTRKSSTPSLSSPTSPVAPSASSQMAEIVRKANERKASAGTSDILKDTPKPTSGDGSAGTSGVDRERTMSVKERLGLKKTESGPSNAKVAATFGQPKAAWQYAANDATTPALVTVVEQATKSKSPTGLGKGEDLIIKVRYHDTRRMRVKPDISVQALEARIMEKFGMKESVDLWWSDQGRATRLSGQSLSYSFKNRGGDVFCMPAGKKPVF